MNIGSLLMMVLFMLTMFHATIVSMVWLRLPLWAVMVVGPLLGWVAAMLLVAALAWLRGLWWSLWKQRLSKGAPRWLACVAGLLSWEVFKRSDDGQGS